MKSELGTVLKVATEQLERQTQEENPRIGVNGHLYFLVERLAELKLSERQQQQVQHILALHRQCTYPLASREPDTEWETKNGRLISPKTCNL